MAISDNYPLTYAALLGIDPTTSTILVSSPESLETINKLRTRLGLDPATMYEYAHETLQEIEQKLERKNLRG